LIDDDYDVARADISSQHATHIAISDASLATTCPRRGLDELRLPIIFVPSLGRLKRTTLTVILFVSFTIKERGFIYKLQKFATFRYAAATSGVAAHYTTYFVLSFGIKKIRTSITWLLSYRK